MRLLLVHPSSLMYSEIFLRLEPSGLERVAGAARDAGHEVRVIDLRIESHASLDRQLVSFAPQAMGVSLNSLASVVPTTLPLDVFYQELVRTQAVINRKHLGLRTAVSAARVLAGNLARGHTNFARMLWRFNRVHNPRRQLADHARPVTYELPLPRRIDVGDRRQLYVHTRSGRGETGQVRPVAKGPGEPC